MFKFCANCEKPFETDRPKQMFCSRDCFKSNYIQKLKVEKPPEFCCPKCGGITKLYFNPRKEKELWKNFVCPNCGYKKEEEELNN